MKKINVFLILAFTVGTIISLNAQQQKKKPAAKPAETKKVVVKPAEPKKQEEPEPKKTESSHSNNQALCFDGNSKIINLGIGFGGINYYSNYNSSGWGYKTSPAFSLSYEQALPEKVGPGYLGLGIYFGFQSSNSTRTYYWDKNGYNSNYYYRYTWNNYMIAARGAYHLDALNSEKAELYFGLLAGLRIQTYKYEHNNPDPNRDNYSISNSSIYPAYSLFIGGRYYFSKNIAVFAEFGYGISYLTAGVSFKF